MKLIGIVGSNAEVSYNRTLLQYIAKSFTDLFELEVVEIKDIPLFNQSDDQTKTGPIQVLNRKILQADGVIIATPEHNHTIPAALKSVIEWLSFKVHPFDSKPVMIVGASYHEQGSSRAQLHLRQILNAPGVNAYVFPGNEFLLGNAKTAFDESGNIKDQKTVEFLQLCLQKFTQYVTVISSFEKPTVNVEPEDLFATKKISTTIEGVDMEDDHWVEKAAEMVGAVEGDTYVKLDCGILTVNQIDYLLKSIPMELSFVDDNNQFLYYNHAKPTNQMFVGREPKQVGSSMGSLHPEHVFKSVEWVLQQLRSGATDQIRMASSNRGPDRFVAILYQAVFDNEGRYAGVNENVFNLKPLVDWYLEQTGQQLVGGKEPDGVSGASAKQKTAPSPSPVAPAKEVEADAVSGASESH